jgi:hypothetical protein
MRIVTYLVIVIAIWSCTLAKNDYSSSLYSDVDTTRFSKGDTVTPFSFIQPDSKQWKVVIEIAGDDMEGISEQISGRKLYTENPRVLGLIKKWRFVYNEGDLATVTSSILVYKRGSLVDQQGIVLDSKVVGLQSIKYGWITPVSADSIFYAIERMETKYF